MADTKFSALASATTLTDTDVLGIDNGGASKKVDLTTLTAYFEARARQNNASVTQQAIAAVDLYMTGSAIAIPNNPAGGNRLQAKTMYRARIAITKTSTTGSTATPIVTLRFGTAGTTADTARATLTFAAQTAVVDTGFLEVFATFRTVGSGTAGLIRATGILDHINAATGLSTQNVSIAQATSAAGFDSTVQNSIIGLSFNGGTSFAGTTDMVQAELWNLA